MYYGADFRSKKITQRLKKLIKKKLSPQNETDTRFRKK